MTPDRLKVHSPRWKCDQSFFVGPTCFSISLFALFCLFRSSTSSVFSGFSPQHPIPADAADCGCPVNSGVFIRSQATLRFYCSGTGRCTFHWNTCASKIFNVVNECEKVQHVRHHGPRDIRDVIPGRGRDDLKEPRPSHSRED